MIMSTKHLIITDVFLDNTYIMLARLYGYRLIKQWDVCLYLHHLLYYALLHVHNQYGTTYVPVPQIELLVRGIARVVKHERYLPR